MTENCARRFQLGALVFAALRMNYGVLCNPFTLLSSCRRLERLYDLAPGQNEFEKSSAILTTAVHMLGAGNQAIYSDIGPALEALIWDLFKDRWPAIMAAFQILYATPEEAWDFPEAYRTYALGLP